MTASRYRDTEDRIRLSHYRDCPFAVRDLPLAQPIQGMSPMSHSMGSSASAAGLTLGVLGLAVLVHTLGLLLVADLWRWRFINPMKRRDCDCFRGVVQL